MNVALLHQGDLEGEAGLNAIARIITASRSDSAKTSLSGHRALVRSSVGVPLWSECYPTYMWRSSPM
ncbi:hypothetical protein HK405_010337, partial [Cladochytrium tenue]